MNKSFLYLSGFLLLFVVLFLFFFLGYITDTDFRAFYTTGDIVRHGFAHEIYTISAQNYWQRSLFSGIPFQTLIVFLNPPFVALGYVLFSFLSPQIGYATLLCLNIAIMLFSLRFVFLRLDRKKWLFFGLFVLLYQPLLMALIEGQNTPLLFLGVVGGWVFFKKHKAFQAGLAISLLAIKPQLLLFPLILFIWKWQWRALLGLCLALCVFLSISLAMVGFGGLFDYGRFLLASASFGEQYSFHPLYEPTIRGFLQLIFLTQSFQAIRLPLFVGIICMAGVFFSIFRGEWQTTTAKFDKQWGILIFVILLTSLHTNDHDLTLLLFPLLMWLNTIKSKRQLYFTAGAIDLVLFPFFIYTSILVPLFVGLLVVLLKSFLHTKKQMALDS